MGYGSVFARLFWFMREDEAFRIDGNVMDLFLGRKIDPYPL